MSRSGDRMALRQCSGCGMKKRTSSHSHNIYINGQQIHCGYMRVVDRPTYVYKLGTKERVKAEE